ncbi:hypothetical protein ACWDTD_01510 [Gordonia sp. NPDC003425]
MANDGDYRSITLNGREYLPELAAQRYAGRGRTTLFEWRRSGYVDARLMRLSSGRSRWYYRKSTLRIAARAAAKSKRDQLHVPGPGRGRIGERSPEVLADARKRAEERRERKAATRPRTLDVLA